MESDSEYHIYLTSAAVAVGCVCATYYFTKTKNRLRDAVEAFHYLNINVVTTEDVCDDVISELWRRCNTHRALGFDCEWVTENGRRQPVALVQLSSYDGYCGLFRLCCLKKIPESLKNLLEDETIYKVGVAAADDGRYLSQDYSVELKSTLDVRHIAELCGYQTGGLAVLSADLLGVVLDKSWRQFEAESLARCGGLSRLRYGDIAFVQLKDIKPNKEAMALNKRYPNATRTKPLYHNCFLQAPDGELLCTCDNKKALWYVEKELADIVKEDPLTVRLRFEPAGRSVGDVGRYYQMTKENKCVVCGASNSYIRKNVVPREYRKYFPEIMKDHSSHDVLLLCTQCHQKSNIRDQLIREKLARVCSAPLASHTAGKYLEDQICKKIRSAARALLYQSRKHVLPKARVEELEEILLQYYPECTEITEELLREASEVDVVYPNEDYETHGLKVVEYFLVRPGGLLRLEELWREHFLTSMTPKYMPDLWSVKHNEERLKVKWNEGRLSERDLESIGVNNW
ncbi:hypothetical protein K1T71_003523 [Dendrolimus kikuchii]|uniref:Uncharacterized protein n=1 Tax=Dendrolimus kikuchii TaxID=765133 RepID=A0ACC1DCU9_9NEOP|nr:hypothetical protein K1T71_003523 [Dendrolimus kikuchii]